MYFVSLKNINQEKNFQIPLDKLTLIDDHLNTLIPNQSISPRYLSRISKVEHKIIKNLLSELSFRGLLDVRFIINCKNEDSDMIHAMEFNSEDELLEFIRKADDCPHCGCMIDTTNIRVSFIKKDFESYKGENYG